MLCCNDVSLFAQNYSIVDYWSAYKLIEYSDEHNIVVAVIDGGFLINHNEFDNVFWQNGKEIINDVDDDKNGYVDDVCGWNFLNNTSDVSNNGSGNWHGTPVAGLIHLLVNGSSFDKKIKVKILPIVKGEDIVSIIESFEYIYCLKKRYNDSRGIEGANIVAINCSWGKEFLWAADYQEWCSIYDKLGKEGVLVVHSVPNIGVDIATIGDMPSTCDSEYLITVTNSDNTDSILRDAAYSNSFVDIAAPGEHSLTIGNSGDFGYFNGTSASSPYVTSTIVFSYLLPISEVRSTALIYPDSMARIVKESIISGVDVVDSYSEIVLSKGRLNMYKSLVNICDYFRQMDIYNNAFSGLNILKVSTEDGGLYFNVLVESNFKGSANLKIVDSIGRVVYTESVTLDYGIQEISIMPSSKGSGIYIMVIYGNSFVDTIKFLITV